MKTDALPRIPLEGAPHERGRMHGEMLRNEIAALLDLWDQYLCDHASVRRSEYVASLISRTSLVKSVATHASAALEEVQGIAEGAHQPFEVVFAFQCVNEEFWFAPSLRGRGHGEACSTIVCPARTGRPSLVAQNLDLAAYLDGWQTLFQIPCANGVGEILALSVPGMISLNGMNSRGLAVCDNALNGLRRDPDGLPVFAFYRLLLEAPDVCSALHIIERHPSASGINWVIGDPNQVAMIERSAGEAVVQQAGPGAPPLFHTNQPLHNAERANEADLVRPTRSSKERFLCLSQRMGERTDLESDDLIQMLSAQDNIDYPVSRTGVSSDDDEIGFTLASSVFELSPDGPVWRLAPGPPHMTAFRAYTF
jgi:hypothetical protein